MKATHRRGKLQELFCFRIIKHQIDAKMIEQTITIMKELDEPLNKSSIIAYLQDLLYGSGRTFFDYKFYDDNRPVSNEAEELSRKLFPLFYE